MRLSLAGTKFDNRFLPSFTEFYRVFNGFDWVVQGLLGCDEVFTELDWVLPGLNGYGWVQQCFTGFRWGFTEFYRVLPSFTELYRVFMGFYRVWLDSTRFHRVLMRFPQVGLGLSRILFVCCFFLPSFSGFLSVVGPSAASGRLCQTTAAKAKTTHQVRRNGKSNSLSLSLSGACRRTLAWIFSLA